VACQPKNYSLSLCRQVVVPRALEAGVARQVIVPLALEGFVPRALEAGVARQVIVPLALEATGLIAGVALPVSVFLARELRVLIAGKWAMLFLPWVGFVLGHSSSSLLSSRPITGAFQVARQNRARSTARVRNPS